MPHGQYQTHAHLHRMEKKHNKHVFISVSHFFWLEIQIEQNLNVVHAFSISSSIYQCNAYKTFRIKVYTYSDSHTLHTYLLNAHTFHFVFSRLSVRTFNSAAIIHEFLYVYLYTPYMNEFLGDMPLIKSTVICHNCRIYIQIVALSVLP